MSSFSTIDTLSLSTVTGGAKPQQAPGCQPAPAAPIVDFHPKFTGVKNKKSPITYNGGSETKNVGAGVGNGNEVSFPLIGAGGGGVE